MYLDNHGAMDLLKEAHDHQCTKHIDIHYHFVHGHVEDGTFEIVHCPTEIMIADGLTKPLAHDAFFDMVDALGHILY